MGGADTVTCPAVPLGALSCTVAAGAPPGLDAVDVTRASARALLQLRRDTIGYVSQFLRVVPRVAALDVVAEVLLARGVDAEAATVGAVAEQASLCGLRDAQWAEDLRLGQR